MKVHLHTIYVHAVYGRFVNRPYKTTKVRGNIHNGVSKPPPYGKTVRLIPPDVIHSEVEGSKRRINEMGLIKTDYAYKPFRSKRRRRLPFGFRLRSLRSLRSR